MNYSFDPRKLALNVEQHGVWFSEADRFEWEGAVTRVDVRRSYGETRFIAAGYIGLRLHVMVFALRGTEVRVISLRKANKREMKRYAET